MASDACRSANSFKLVLVVMCINFADFSRRMETSASGALLIGAILVAEFCARENLLPARIRAMMGTHIAAVNSETDDATKNDAQPAIASNAPR